MHTELNIMLVQSRHTEMLAKWRQRRPSVRASRRSAPTPHWGAVTMRLATSSDKPALERLAELGRTSAPLEPVLLGVVTQYPVAAMSLADGQIVAEPTTDTRELLELMKLRARQLQRTA